MKQREPQAKLIKIAKRLNAATEGGLLGVVAGKVKTRDGIAITCAAVLFVTSLWEREGLLVGVAVGAAITVGCGLLIRLWKWRTGVPRSSSDY